MYTRTSKVAMIVRYKINEQRKTMTTHKIVKYERWLLGLYLIIFTMIITSCSYDYFEDENNFRLYVPQIENSEITNFYISIHDASGRHVLTREINAPFDNDELMKQGILRFKLPYGKDYTVTCFADYATEATTPGNPYADSYLKKTSVDGTFVYASRTTNPRSFLSTATVYPIGHPEAAIARVVNIDQKQCYKGKVIVNFKELPTFVSRVDIYYKGLATKYNFNGTFDRFSPSDLILASFKTSDYTSGNIVSFEDIINPSAGVNPFGMMDPLQPLITKASYAPSGEPLELEMRLFDAVGTNVGTIPFTDDDFQRLKNENSANTPTDADGNVLDHLVLEPQKTIIFTFKGFTIISIELRGWGDIIGGGSTPM